MKGVTMSRTRFFLAAILAIVVAAMAGGGTIAAADAQDARGQGLFDLFRGGEIVGTWQATVTRGPLPSLTSLHTFTSDRTMIESGNDSLFRSPGFGVWEYIGNRTYATTLHMHRFNAAGEPIGSITVNANRQVSADGETYVGVGVNTVRDLAGNVIGGGRSTVTGRRVHVERIPDLP
jgi:hypothetical protein